MRKRSSLIGLSRTEAFRVAKQALSKNMTGFRACTNFEVLARMSYLSTRKLFPKSGVEQIDNIDPSPRLSLLAVRGNQHPGPRSHSQKGVVPFQFRPNRLFRHLSQWRNELEQFRLGRGPVMLCQKHPCQFGDRAGGDGQRNGRTGLL